MTESEIKKFIEKERLKIMLKEFYGIDISKTNNQPSETVIKPVINEDKSQKQKKRTF